MRCSIRSCCAAGPALPQPRHVDSGRPQSYSAVRAELRSRQSLLRWLQECSFPGGIRGARVVRSVPCNPNRSCSLSRLGASRCLYSDLESHCSDGAIRMLGVVVALVFDLGISWLDRSHCNHLLAFDPTYHGRNLFLEFILPAPVVYLEMEPFPGAIQRRDRDPKRRIEEKGLHLAPRTPNIGNRSKSISRATVP